MKYKADSTLRASRAVPHPSTDRALCRLTSEVERDPVHSTWYGRQRKLSLRPRRGKLAHSNGMAVIQAQKHPSNGIREIQFQPRCFK